MPLDEIADLILIGGAIRLNHVLSSFATISESVFL